MFAVHKTWKDKHTQAQTQVDAENKKNAALQAEKDTAAKTHQEEKDALTNRAVAAEANLGNMTQQIATLTQQNNDLQTKTRQFLGVAESKTAEAGAARTKRPSAGSRTTSSASSSTPITSENRKFRDTLFARDLELKELKDRFNSTLSEYGEMRTFLASRGSPSTATRSAAPRSPPEGHGPGHRREAGQDEPA